MYYLRLNFSILLPMTGDGSKILTEHSIAALRGISKIPRGQEKLLHNLFDQCLPQMSPCIAAYINEDDILKAYMLLLRDYAEVYCIFIFETYNALLFT
jgi:hypothetical protein